MQTSQPPVADIPMLSERYGINEHELEKQLSGAIERMELPEPWELQGVRVWKIEDADAWYCRHLRADYQVLQYELADALGVCQSTVSKWERGGGVPRYVVPKLRRIAEEIAAAKKDAA